MAGGFGARWNRSKRVQSGLVYFEGRQTSPDWTRLLRGPPNESRVDSLASRTAKRVQIGLVCFEGGQTSPDWTRLLRGRPNESRLDSFGVGRLSGFEGSQTSRFEGGQTSPERTRLLRGRPNESRADSFGVGRLSGWQAGLARGGIAANESGIDSFALLGVERGQTSPERTRLVSGD
ncbi:hypothetical protein GGU10DRAFT_382191 [Lentinula aff. detonsa]|uniref:Uncharacterized protein n=1 Tax=Lentinula aff. detonsa TaxID=2804958 RepID=A0AA38NIT4_9AGAR|nr:hypothetical protein GGU10DRAFT_382191 [Lentinula aff. detonsa]